MKKVKKFFAAVMAVAMAVSMMAPVTAADPTGGITVQAVYDEAVYKVYKILDLDDHQGDNYAYSIQADSPWYVFIQSKNDIFEFSGQYTDPITSKTKHYVRLKTGVTMNATQSQQLAQEVIAYANSNHIDPTATLNKANGFSNQDLSLGYYAVESNMGILCALTTADPFAIIAPKNTVVNVDKNVKEDSDNGYNKQNSAQIGDKVDYQTTLTIPMGSESVILHDRMDEGLSMVRGDSGNEISSVTVKLGDKTLKGVYLTKPDGATNDDWITAGMAALNPGLGTGDPSSYVLSGAGAIDSFVLIFDHNRVGETSGAICDFDIQFTQAFLNYITAVCVNSQNDPDITKHITSMNIVVEYSAMLNENAKMAGGSNDNKTFANFGENHDTTISTTQTLTYSFDIAKTDQKGVMLDGAKFKLYSADVSDLDTKEEVKLIEVTPGREYRVAAAGETNYAAEISVLRTAIIKGLDADDKTVYFLQETEAPRGYNKLDQPIVIYGTSDAVPAGTDNPNILEEMDPVKYTENAEKEIVYLSGGVKVINQTGTLLPETGGIGTTIFYAVGGLLVVCAGVLLVTKKRMDD